MAYENHSGEQHSDLLSKIKFAFCDHPRQAGETYFEHLMFTLGMATRLFFSAVCLLIHGVFPFLCVHTASKSIRGCHAILDERALKTGGKPSDAASQ